jgi:hypothetical protein
MADEPAKSPAKKKGKKLKTPQKAAIGIGGALVVYVLYRWYQNRAATTASTTAAGATDPLTGQPYAAGVGSLAAGTDQGAAIPAPADPTIDPSTGQTWASEIAAADVAGGIDPATGVAYSGEVSQYSAWASDLTSGINPLTDQPFATSVSPAGTSGSGLTPDTAGLAATRADLIARVEKATGLTSAQAGQQVALYLEGKPLTNAGAVNSIGNAVTQATATQAANPGYNQVIIPTPVLAKSVTQAKSPVSAPTSSALTNAEAVAKKDQGTAAEAQAQANVTRTKAIVAKQK